MDDMVIAAMAKWPHVPACYGWLGLDARGDWFMRDAASQAAGSFQVACRSGVPHAGKGSRLLHPALLAFVGRNYVPDEQGRWCFQNGPQKVFVELACTPWVWRIDGSGTVQAHTGSKAERVHECLLDQDGRVYLATEKGLGLVHSLDVPQAAQCVEAGLWMPQEVYSVDLPTMYGYQLSPEHPQA